MFDTYNDPMTLGTDVDASEAPSPARRRKPAGKLKVALLTLASMLAVLVLAAGGFALYLNHLLDSNIKHSAMLPVGEQPTKDPGAGDAQNILLLGSDSRDREIGAGSRSDVIQLLHVNNDRSRIDIIHFPRDMYVEIPGHGKNKINAAYSYGGAPLLVQTMENMLNLRIDHVAQIDFQGFADLTDTLGGVRLYVPQGFDEAGFGSWTKGWHDMNGEQALGFVRERHQLTQGDLDRGRNQQAWIKAVLTKTLSAGTLLNPIKLTDAINDVTKYTTVDESFDSATIRSLALSLRDIRGDDLHFKTAPISGFQTIDGQDVDIVDSTLLSQLGKALVTDQMSTYTEGTNVPNPGA
ncbi:LytR family transcriptional attenuator [Branchiibius hedensis]|uniref:Cell envelope-related function transcriptional attenuator common domain-containing protein n=2 Tax=Branchiibius hedensis TaxID=672460 RepID=A0A2Y8ZYW1_9MICO|nr:LytR family transcriptional attenuator [Branchiibius hedensis]SSA35419.1 cell envelope-related function transcriptional attenuator common domain-containing protein [Branchiibius hedensis]